MKPTKINKTKELIKEISVEILNWVRRGEVINMVTEHRNPSSKTAYKGINRFILNMIAKEQGFENNHWLTFNQVSELGGLVNKGAASTPVFFASPVFKYKGSDGKTFTVTASSRIDADLQAHEKDAGAVYDNNYVAVKYYRVFNVVQTSISDKFANSGVQSALVNPSEARRLIFLSLDEKKDFYDRKLISLFGAACLTQTRPTEDEISLIDGWLKKLDENPNYLYWTASAAHKAADEVLDSLRRESAA